MLLGDSFQTSTTIWAAESVTVQLSPGVKSLSGLRVNVVGPPLSTAVCAPLVEQVMAYHELVTVTASLSVTPMSASTATPVAPFAGDVVETAGGASPPA